MAKKKIYLFGGKKTEGRGDMKELLGGKGAGLAEMSRLGIPVPAGFTITTEVCTEYYKNGGRLPRYLEGEVKKALAHIEKTMERRFGDEKRPLLLSVRSGARVSMPGMMDTVLNLGLNDRTVRGLAKDSGDERFAWDCYRRFVQMYGDVVLGLKPASKDEIDPFEAVLHKKKESRQVKYDHELDATALKELVAEFKKLIQERTGHSFPEDPWVQLWGAIEAVFRSWNNPRAIAYRELNKIPGDWGTAVNVQAMVFGNLGEDSGTGVLFTRNPATGENEIYGEFLMNAQGEDVVAGIRTPLPLSKLAEIKPDIYKQIKEIASRVERHYRDMQDMEFTIQQGKLWMLQTRSGKRTGFAAVRIAVDQAMEGIISKEEALLRVEPGALAQLLQPVFDERDKLEALTLGRLLAKGLPAGPGAASGRVVFNAEDAEAWARRGETVLLVRIETSPEDIRGMNAAVGILTARGGMTSHAALVARQMGKVCVVGCEKLRIDYKERHLRVDGRTVREGEWLSIDGTTGEVIEGRLRTTPSEVIRVLRGELEPAKSRLYQCYQKLMSWADKRRRLGVWTNADQPDQAQQAVMLGAEGIGLCRTEHMFFGEGKIGPMREMILADTPEARQKALEKLLPMQRRDFQGIFEVMGERPVTIRTLDPPLHEFLPHQDHEIRELAGQMGLEESAVRGKVASLREANPMLGHRGCRLGITYPEITAMQTRAILEAACVIKKSKGFTPRPEIMIPLVANVNELAHQKKVVLETAEKVFAEQGVKIPFSVGTMIELPRAAIVADQIAREAEFFSFGTNDLTQTTYGLSRDDAGRFLAYYREIELLKEDPFQTIDTEGVGQLMKWAVERGRSTRPKLKVGICGEHGGDPATIAFCHQIGLDYVSCSPFRVPIARLAAAQAAIKYDGQSKKKVSGKKAKVGKKRPTSTKRTAATGARRKTGRRAR